MIQELTITDFSSFPYDSETTVKDGIRDMVIVWRIARLGWSQATTETERMGFAYLQGFTYGTIQDLRKLPLTDKLLANEGWATDEEVCERRSQIRLVS
jgi:hypothetical protein